MDLANQLHPSCALARIRVADKQELLRRQVEAIHLDLSTRYDDSPSLDLLLEAVMERERQESTGLGEGVAFPHARIPGFLPLGFSVATLAEPLDFDAVDGRPVGVCCMVIAAAETPNILLKIWSGLASLLMRPEVRGKVQQASDSAGLVAVFQQHSLDIDTSLTAGDIMLEPLFEVRIDTPLTKVTNNMYRFREPATGVIDGEGRLIGEITSDAVFQYGMPEFFTQLQSVGFIRHFNPLEKYFKDEARMKAGDIMASNYAAVEPSATLLEVLFQLSIKQRTKVYVVDDEGKLVGVVGRLSVLNRAINF